MGVVLGLGLALVAAGCGGDDEPAVGERPDLPTEPVARWNPCDGLDVPGVDRLFATTFTAATGTETEPRCTFSPAADGDPAVDVNYQLFPGTLDELFETFGDLPDDAVTRVEEVEVAAADDAALVADVGDDGTLAVTGFVQNGDLVQVVNAIDPEPFDRATVTAGVRTLLADLAIHARDSGLVRTDTPTDDGSG